MNGGSLGALAFIASLATSSALAQKSVSQMTREEINAEVISLCNNPKVMENIIHPDRMCEFSTDNGKTWKEYIPSLPNLPNGTSGFAGGLLALIAAGAVIMRFRKKDEYTISPDLRKKYVPPAKPKDEPKNTPFTDTILNEDDLLDQALRANPEYKGLGHAMQQENTGIVTLPPFSQIETPVHQIDILLDGDQEKNTEMPLLTEVVVNDKVDIGTSVPGLVTENNVDTEAVTEPITTSTSPVQNIMKEDTLLEALQGGILDKEGKKKLNVSLPEGNSYRRVYLPQKNAVGRYGFTISEDESGMITIIRDKQTGYIYTLDTTGKIQELEEFSISGIKAVQVIENGYLQFIVGNEFERKVILLSKGKISLS